MIKRLYKHIFSLHERVELWVLYGIFMFLLGMGMNHIFSTSSPYGVDDEVAEVIDPAVEKAGRIASIPERLPVPPDEEAWREEKLALKEEDLQTAEPSIPEQLETELILVDPDTALELTEDPQEIKIIEEVISDKNKQLEEVEAEGELEVLPPIPVKKPVDGATIAEIMPVAKPKFADHSKESEEAHEVVKEAAEEIEEEAQEKKEGVVLAEGKEFRALDSKLVVKKGSTFNNMLVKAGVSYGEAANAAKEISKVYNLRNLRIGQNIKVIFDENLKSGELLLNKIEIDNRDEVVVLSSLGDSKFKAVKEAKKLEVKVFYKGGVVDSSLYGLANNKGIPTSVMAEAIHHFSYTIDFQRDIKSGATFDALYEMIYDSEGHLIRTGNLLFASIKTDKTPIQLYRFDTTGEGDAEYFTREGGTLRRALMRTPLNGARISSGFGKRKHPILGYTKMHKGTDFAAPRGTPVFAAGDGKIVKMGRNGGYGKYIRIRHNSTYQSAYAHLHKYAKNMRVGRKVKQGQIIAYVGSTGRSTGPHLHYEVLKNGGQVNPMRIKMPPGRNLNGKKLKEFIKVRDKIDVLRQQKLKVL